MIVNLGRVYRICLMISVKSETHMGGFGSGQSWRWDAKDVTEDHLSIDIRQWHKKGLFEPSKTFIWRWFFWGDVIASISVLVEAHEVIIGYRKKISYCATEQSVCVLDIDRTNCAYGGTRPWFLCPNKKCRRRVAIMYYLDVFACRHCHVLRYSSQREKELDKYARKAENIRCQLGWWGGIFDGDGEKPKGMHWVTYNRLLSAYRLNLEMTSALAAVYFGKDKMVEF